MYMHLVNELKGSNGHLLHNPFHCLTFSVNNLLANPPKPHNNLHPWKNPLHLLPPFIQIQNMRLNHPTIFRVSFSCICYCTYYTAREALCNWHSLGRGCFWVWLCNLGSCIGWIYLRLIVASRRIFGGDGASSPSSWGRGSSSSLSHSSPSVLAKLKSMEHGTLAIERIIVLA